MVKPVLCVWSNFPIIPKPEFMADSLTIITFLGVTTLAVNGSYVNINTQLGGGSCGYSLLLELINPFKRDS